MSLLLGLSNKSYRISANVNFFSRVLATFSIRNNFNLGLAYQNSLGISYRRAVRSIKVTLNGTFSRTLNSGNKVVHCKDFFVPVSRTLKFYTTSVDNEPFLIFRTDFPRRHVNTFSAYVYRRFFHTFTIGSNVALRLHIPCKDGSRRVTRTLFGTFTRTLGVTIRGGTAKRALSAGKIL